MLAQQRPGVIPFPLVPYSVRQLLELPLDDNTLPFSTISRFLHDERNLRVGTHEIDLSARQRECVEMVVGIGEIDRHDIRSSVLGAGTVSEPGVGQQPEPSRVTQRVNMHYFFSSSVGRTVAVIGSSRPKPSSLRPCFS